MGWPWIGRLGWAHFQTRTVEMPGMLGFGFGLKANIFGFGLDLARNLGLVARSVIFFNGCSYFGRRQ